MRIERLWWDFTVGLGSKWHEFFESLEVHDRLDINNDAHMWLLHFLFLDALNQEITVWANGWNTHVMSLRDQRNQSPASLFYFGCITKGLRGKHPSSETVPDEPVDDPEAYGIDWEVLQDQHLRQHHNWHNQDDVAQDGLLDQPLDHTRFSQVEVPGYDCPLSPDQILQLRDALLLLGHLDTHDMNIRRLMWQVAFHVCTAMATV